MYRFKQIILLVGDLLILYLGLYLALFFRYFNDPERLTTIGDLVNPMSLLFILAVVVFFVAGTYDLERSKNDRNLYLKILTAALVWMFLGVAYFYVNPKLSVAPKTILLLTAVFGFGLLLIWRYLYNKFLSTSIGQLNVAFVGLNNEARELIKFLRNQPQTGYNIKAIIDSNQNAFELNLPIHPDLSEVKDKLNLIVVSPQMEDQPKVMAELYGKLFKQTSVVGLADFYEQVMGRVPPFTFSEGWFIANLQEQKKIIYDRFRTIIDYLIAIIVGLFFVVTFLPIALIIKIFSPGPIFFTQKRVGKMGKTFSIVKYRSMKVLSEDGSAETSGPQFAQERDKRITAVGKILRRTRLDEIPQFINILRGEMSLIGPRPERPAFVAELTASMPYYSLRHLIKPGITGWAQIKQGYSNTTEGNLKKLEYDVYYIKNRGPALDLAIMLKTLNTLIRFAGK